MKGQRDWAGIVFWSAVLLVIVAAIVVSTQLPTESKHIHTNPTSGDVNNGALVIGTGLVLVLMFYGWIEWNKRHPPPGGERDRDGGGDDPADDSD